MPTSFFEVWCKVHTLAARVSLSTRIVGHVLHQTYEAWLKSGRQIKAKKWQHISYINQNHSIYNNMHNLNWSFPATECNQQEFGYFTGSQAHSRLLHRDALAPNDPQGIPQGLDVCSKSLLQMTKHPICCSS
jgi:hypothetical protein